MNYEEKYQTSFDICDYMAAKEAFEKWQIEQSCDIDDYIIRKRKAELQQLIRKVIKNELDEKEQLLVELHWYKNLNQRQIAATIGVEPSTVCRKLEKINDIIYEKLKYAIEYRYGFGNKESVKEIIKNNFKLLSQNSGSVGLRLRKLRLQNFLKIEDVAKCTAISKERLSRLEENKCLIKTTEAIALSQFFCVSIDFLLTGKETKSVSH